MTPESLNCPYCNSMVVLPRLPEPEQAIRCPRCQELFSYHGESGTQTQANAPMADPPAEGVLVHGDRQGPARPKRVSNRAIAQVVLGVMALMAGIALVFAWTTTDGRRQHDYQSRFAPTMAIAPANLSGLAYLPSHFDVIAGVHVAELADRQDTRRFVGDLLWEWFGIRDLMPSLGLNLADIDHVVLGNQVASPLHPLLVVQIRRVELLENVRHRLGARRIQLDKTDKKTLYSFPTQFPLITTGYLWCATDQTLVFGISQEDLKNISLTPEPSTDRFSPPIQKTLSQLKEGTPIWSVGHSEDLGIALNMLQLLSGRPNGLLPKDKLAMLSDLRTVGMWVKFDIDEVIYHLEAGCKDAEAAKKLDQYLAQNWPEKEKPIPLLANLPHARVLFKDISSSLKREQKDEWITLDAKSNIRLLYDRGKSGKIIPPGRVRSV